MSLPLRNLPVLQQWDCHACSDCCRIQVPISDAERERLASLDLAGDAAIPQGPWFKQHGGGWTLAHRDDGGCIFLTAANRCRLHERFGAAAKPMACRLFPFLLIPAGDHWRVGMHYACPSAAENRGRPLREHEEELRRLVPLVEQHVGRSADTAPPPDMEGSRHAAWPEALRVTQTLVEMIEDEGCRLELRLRRCLAFAALCHKARFDNLTGSKLSEFLKLMRTAVENEVPRAPSDVPRPGWMGRVLFRSLLAIYARRDSGLYRGPATRSGLKRLHAGWRFARGRGAVPRVNALIAETTFAAVEQRGPLPAEIDASLERYYVTKLTSLQFCGPPNFDFPFWMGVDSLIVTFPILLWLARALSADNAVDAVHQAMVLADQHFGSNRLLGSWRSRFFLHTLAEHGEIAKLVAWYGR